MLTNLNNVSAECDKRWEQTPISGNERSLCHKSFYPYILQPIVVYLIYFKLWMLDPILSMFEITKKNWVCDSIPLENLKKHYECWGSYNIYIRRDNHYKFK